MLDELQFLWFHMRGDFGFLMAVISWMTALRLCLKPISSFFDDYIKQASEIDKIWIQNTLNSHWWRFLAFLLNYLASINLPTIPKKTGNTEILLKK